MLPLPRVNGDWVSFSQTAVKGILDKTRMKINIVIIVKIIYLVWVVSKAISLIFSISIIELSLM